MIAASAPDLAALEADNDAARQASMRDAELAHFKGRLLERGLDLLAQDPQTFQVPDALSLEMARHAHEKLFDCPKWLNPNNEAFEAAIRAASKAALDQFQANPNRPDPEIEKLAALPTFEYEKIRRQEAKRLGGVRVSALDAEVAKLRPPASPKNSESLAPPPPAPWPEPVEPRAVLDELRDFIRRFAIVDDHTLVAITLWIAFTYFFAVAETSPRLAIISPTKRCGKTRLLELLSLLCPSALSASNLTPSAIFRTIHSEKCVLLIDEADTFANGNDELRGLLNSGHSRASAYVIRAVPSGEKDWTPKRFSTWAPVAVAAIGKLPETWLDRSITIAMKRKHRAQSVERLTRRNTAARAQAVALSQKIARLANDQLEEVRGAEPKPAALDSDRQVDNWEMLLAVADLAGGDWPTRARAAAVALSSEQGDAGDSLGVRLLADCKTIFEYVTTPTLGSTEVVDRLCGLPDSLWETLARGKPLTSAKLARVLADFGISPQRTAARREYKIVDFNDAFARYLPIPPDQSVKASQTIGRVVRNGDLEASSDDALKRAGSITERMGSDALTLPNGRIPADHDFSSLESPREKVEIDRLAAADAADREDESVDP